jgi:UDP-glucose:(heptosyl)LPS alpha-1,3-glucosyltransferase
MRIGIVAFEIDRHSGGMGHWCWQFVGALAAHGHQVHVIVQRLGEAQLPASVTRHVVSAVQSRMAFASAAAERVERLELDVVHDMGAGWNCDVFHPHGGSHYAWLQRRLNMYPAWLRFVKRPIDALLPRQRDFLRHARRQFALRDSLGKTFVALSHGVADDFVRLHGIRPEQIAVVPNGVDCRRFSPVHRVAHRETVRRQLGVNDETMLLLLAAHNFRLKGVPELLAVAGRLVANSRDVRVVVAGGKRLTHWRRAAARFGLTDRATFVGSIDNLAPYYAAADVYVHPTYYDPCSLVLLEAAASGLPIVTTRRYNGAAELFHEGDEILTVNDPYDEEALFERIDALIDDRLRAELGAAARRVAMRHPFERNVAEILRVYERPMGRRAAA